MKKLPKDFINIQVSPTLLIVLAVAVTGFITTAILSLRMMKIETALMTLIENSAVRQNDTLPR